MKRIGRSLAAKIVLPLLGLGILFGGAAINVVGMISEAQAHRSLRQQSDQAVASVAANYFGERPSPIRSQRLIQQVIDSGPVLTLWVTNVSSNEIIGAENLAAIGQPVAVLSTPGSRAADVEAERSIMASHDLSPGATHHRFYGPHRMATAIRYERADGTSFTVTATLDTSLIDRQVASAQRPTLFLVLGLLAGLLGAVTILVNHLVLRPLTRLDRLVSKRHPSTTGVPFVAVGHRRDEIGTLARTLQQSFETVHERERALREVHVQLSHQARHDPLTGLPNRRLVIERLERALGQAERSDERVAVLFCDLDRFKVVNDSRGHEVGDELLRHVADRLRAATSGSHTVGRLGGDEFVVIIFDRHIETAAERCADRILVALGQPFSTPAGVIHTSASIGISLAADGATATDLLREADVAMYRAKDGGGGRLERFDPAMDTPAMERHDLEVALREALVDHQVFVQFQPIFHLADDDVPHIVAFEALARWDRPGFGLIPPAAFIPVAEACGAINELGLLVMEEAVAAAITWPTSDEGDPVYVSVNVSIVQLLRPGFAAEVSRVLCAFRLAPELLMLEITETAVMGDLTMVTAVLDDLRRLGVRIAIDDFGTGLSSLTYLRDLPIDAVKIDQSFVDRIDSDSGDSAIVRSVITLSEALGIRVIAEGVERPESASALHELHCPFGQGYEFSAALSARDAHDLLTGPARMPDRDATIA